MELVKRFVYDLFIYLSGSIDIFLVRTIDFELKVVNQNKFLLVLVPGLSETGIHK